MTMKLSIVNKILLGTGVLVLITGLILRLGYHRMLADSGTHAFWTLSHEVLAALLIFVATFHMIMNKWWFASLKNKIVKTRTLVQRVMTTTVVLLFLSLIATGLWMLCGWYGQHSHIWSWHFWLGIAWAMVAVVHGVAFYRPH